jgi:hypothetical protein
MIYGPSVSHQREIEGQPIPTRRWVYVTPNPAVRKVLHPESDKKQAYASSGGEDKLGREGESEMEGGVG